LKVILFDEGSTKLTQNKSNQRRSKKKKKKLNDVQQQQQQQTTKRLMIHSRVEFVITCGNCRETSCWLAESIK